MSDFWYSLANVALTLLFSFVMFYRTYKAEEEVKQQAQLVSTLREDVNYLYDRVVSVEDDIYADKEEQVEEPVTVSTSE